MPAGSSRLVGSAGHWRIGSRKSSSGGPCGRTCRRPWCITAVVPSHDSETTGRSAYRATPCRQIDSVPKMSALPINTAGDGVQYLRKSVRHPCRPVSRIFRLTRCAMFVFHRRSEPVEDVAAGALNVGEVLAAGFAGIGDGGGAQVGEHAGSVRAQLRGLRAGQRDTADRRQRTSAPRRPVALHRRRRTASDLLRHQHHQHHQHGDRHPRTAPPPAGARAKDRVFRCCGVVRGLPGSPAVRGRAGCRCVPRRCAGRAGRPWRRTRGCVRPGRAARWRCRGRFRRRSRSR